MPPPTNISAATATVLTMNSTVSQDVSGATAPLHEVWFAYTAVAADGLVGWWASALAGPYTPATICSQGTPAALEPAFGLAGLQTRPLQVQMTAGVTYYFQVQNTGSTEPLTHPLQLSLTRAPNLAAPAGAIAVNDDTPGFPLVLLSPTDGSVLQARSFPSGETGAILPSGISIWEDADVDPSVVRLYDPALTLQATLAWSYRGDPPLASNRATRFYLGDPGGTFPPPTVNARVTTVTAAGALGGTVWTLPDVGLWAIGVSRDDAVLYHNGQAGTGSSIQRWDLVANAALPPLAATVAGYQSRKEILVLADDSIVVGYYNNSTGSPDSFLRRYSPAGATLRTYPLGAVQLNRLAFALDDPASFWIWSFLTGASDGVSRFQNLRVSDGAVLTTLDNVRYEGGSYRPAVPGPPPPAPPFGHSPSCPFLLLPVALPAYTPPGPDDGGGGPDDGGGGGGGGGLDTGGDADAGDTGRLPAGHLPAGTRIRRLRRAPHLAAEQVEQFFAKFQLDFEAGMGQPADPGLDPQVWLRWSDDGGQTWRGPLGVSAGLHRVYYRRAIWRRLGRGRDRVFEISMDDPVKWALVAAYLDAVKGTS